MATFPLPLAEAKKDMAAIRCSIAIRRLASFAKPPVGNKLAMSAPNDVLGVLIIALAFAKGGD